MAFYQAITTDAGSILNYWDFGRIEFNTSAPDHKDQSADVNMWGYHDITYRTAGSPPIDKYKSYSCNYASATDYYPYQDLTGVSGVVTGTERLGPACSALKTMAMVLKVEPLPTPVAVKSMMNKTKNCQKYCSGVGDL